MIPTARRLHLRIAATRHRLVDRWRTTVLPFLTLLAAVDLASAQASAGAGIRMPPPWTPSSVERPQPLAAGLTTVNGIAFEESGDVFYGSQWVDQLDARGRRKTQIVVQRRTRDGWTKPEPVSWNSAESDYQPVLSPDGQRMFFNSSRPKPGHATAQSGDIWMVERDGGSWGPPKYLADINTDAIEAYPAVTREGVLYFLSDRAGSTLKDVFRATPRLGGFAEPVRIPQLSGGDENDLWVDPGERFVIFNGAEAIGSPDFSVFVSFSRREGGWSPPRRLHGIHRSGVWALTPSVSPDGQAFLFTIADRIHSIALSALLYPDERVAGQRSRGHSDETMARMFSALEGEWRIEVTSPQGRVLRRGSRVVRSLFLRECVEWLDTFTGPPRQTKGILAYDPTARMVRQMTYSNWTASWTVATGDAPAGDRPLVMATDGGAATSITIRRTEGADQWTISSTRGPEVVETAVLNREARR